MCRKRVCVPLRALCPAGTLRLTFGAYEWSEGMLLNGFGLKRVLLGSCGYPFEGLRAKAIFTNSRSTAIAAVTCMFIPQTCVAQRGSYPLGRYAHSISALSSESIPIANPTAIPKPVKAFL